ncbi:TonB-dependent receptor plug domain-containing protein [Camelimonas abortus]|uniref:TonB-dependent receptor plug domain-containing protein n=1 Tax=Camelimonas abortus TaxID=1017184 RepID=A0ABV7LFQ5_9HYPH
MNLDAITVEGAPQASPLVAGPTTAAITRAELDREQVRRISDIGNLPGAGVGFNRNTGSINIRGLEGARVLTTIDGIRQTFVTDSRIDRGAAAAFDFNAPGGLDLLRGTGGGATPGSGAPGGARALRTPDPEDLARNATSRRRRSRALKPTCTGASPKTGWRAAPFPGCPASTRRMTLA